MRILVSNDDGIFSKGILALAEVMSAFGEVFVVAPDQERSASSHSLTLKNPLRAKMVDFPYPVQMAYAVDGTPSDCVKLALSTLFPERPDLVVTGINRGSNLGVDVFYSGTVASAMEAIFEGIPSFAFSLASPSFRADLNPSKIWIKKCIEWALARPALFGVLLNINFPFLPLNEIKGLRLTRLGSVRYQGSYEQRFDPSGHPYFWLKGIVEVLDHSQENDIVAVNDGYVSMTPLRAEMTDFHAIETLKQDGDCPEKI
ncbi:5'/3'-nucleotidase SurE [bacterium]|nr:5'/3'-nucleotidase SurE [bacterium]